MARVDIVTATEAHAHALAQTMRPGDVAELQLGHHTPLGGLLDALKDSDVAYTLCLDGEVALMFGVGKLDDKQTHVGAAWLLTGEAVNRHKRDFLRSSRECIGLLLKHYSGLFAAVDARYRGALRWAATVGFLVWPSVLVGPSLAPFNPITITRDTWATYSAP